MSIRQYATTFNLLSSDFKERNDGPDKGGFEAHVDWWDSVSATEVWSAYIDHEYDRSAKVTAVLHYEEFAGGQYEDTVYCQLQWDDTRQTWLIDANPFG